MLRYIVVTSAIAAFFAMGMFEAARAIRRSDPEQGRVLQKTLDLIPLQLATWHSKDAEFDIKQLEQSGAKAHLFRIFTRANRNDELQVLILAGDPGEIGAHDPQRCYAGAGYRPVGGSQKKELIDPEQGVIASYWSARFDADTFPAVSIQVAWAWTAEGKLKASNDARLEFLGRSALYKIYVTRRLTTVDPTNERDLTESLLLQLVPEIEKALAKGKTS